MRAKRGTAPRRPGTERQPSQPNSVSGPKGSITGLTSAISSCGRSSGRPLTRSSGTTKMTTRRETCTCGRGEAGAADIGQGLDHVGDQSADLGRAGVGHGLGDLAQNRMAHAGDLEDGHGANMRVARGRVKPPVQASQAGANVVSSAPRLPGFPRPLFHWRNRGVLVQVLVRDNNVDQALRALKKKMQREGIFREMKLRRNYEKPSERRAREKAEAVRRYRKLLRKRMEREGY